MKFNIDTLRNQPLARFLARLSNHCTVVLSSGTKIYFSKVSQIHSAISDNSEPLSDAENKEYILAMELIDV